MPSDRFIVSTNGTANTYSSSTVPPGQKAYRLPPQLGRGERGSVILVQIDVVRSGKGFTLNNIMGVDPNLIRSALLLNDKLDFPDNSFYALCPLEELGLNDTSIAQSTIVKWPHSNEYDLLTQYGWLAYQELDKRERGLWSIWQSPEQSVIPKEELTPDMAFRLEFQRSLLVPSENVPFDDVVMFRDRHQDELMALRHHLEEICIKLSNEGDSRSITIEVERFDASLAEYLKKARQSNISKVITTIGAEFEWSAAIRQAILGGGSGGIIAALGQFSLVAASTAIGTGILAGLSIKSTAGLAKSDTSPFRYIARAETMFN